MEMINKIIEELDPYRDPRFGIIDQVSTARLFAYVCRNIIRYNTTARAWYWYDGTRWQRDEEDMHAEKYAKQFYTNMNIYAISLQDDDNWERLSQYRKHFAKYAERNRRMSLLKDARDYNFISAEDLDQDPYLLNVKNGVLDLRSLELLEHDPDLLLSKRADAVYNPKASSTAWIRFIDEVLQGDRQKIQYFQELLGYTLLGINSQEECYILYGATTRNGKSTALETVAALMGDYAMNCEPETLAQRDRNTRNASGDLARLAGCRFLQMSEPPRRMRFDAALLKKLIGRDRITARNIYERETEFVPVFKLFINTNWLPVVTDETLFTSERIKVITFDRHFTPEEQDRTLKNKLRSAENLSGLLNWMIEGLSRFRNNDELLTAPEAVLLATEQYREQSDKIGQFLRDTFIPAPGHNLPIKFVYEKYEEWCSDNGYGVESKGNIIEDLRRRGVFADTGTVNGKTHRRVLRGYNVP